MSRLVTELDSQYWEPVATGPVAQADLTAVAAVPATIAGSGTFTSALMYADGFKAIACGVTLSQNGTLQIKRYIDAAGNVEQTDATATALTAATAGLFNVNDGLPFQSFKVVIVNSGGTTANVTNFVLLLNAA